MNFCENKNKVLKIYYYCRLIYSEKNVIFNAKSRKHGVFWTSPCDFA
jgi:hypothetical protein